MLVPFLTAYDPTDLPGTSIDPLGFERAYLMLADKVLPGLTNAAGRPRYFSVVCAGALLAPTKDEPESHKPRIRTNCVLNIERFWAVANVLASETNQSLSSSGIRGVTFAQKHVAKLQQEQTTATNGKFKMLAAQARYGAVGIYANVAGYIKLLDRYSMSPTRDLGETLGEVFLDETAAPPRLRYAIRDGEGDLTITALRSWGVAAHVAAPAGQKEGKLILEALLTDSTRSRFADFLKRVPSNGESDSELDRLKRICETANDEVDNKDLREAIRAILAFEECYCVALLGFERMLWLCRHEGSIAAVKVSRDPIILSCADQISRTTKKLERAVADGSTQAFLEKLDRLEDVREFLGAASADTKNSDVFVTALFNRHADVQHGKFDRGMRKLPWLVRNKDSYELTLSQVGDVRGEPTSVTDIRPHEYRVAAADRFIAAGEGRPA